MKILNTAVNVSAKTPFYIQSPDLDTPRLVKWTIPSAGTITLWGRMETGSDWVSLATSTLTDQVIVTLMPQIAATLAGIDSGTVTVEVNVNIETRDLVN